MSFTIGSLFDGSGGFPLAATMCGGVPVWASEIEPYPIAVTRSRFPRMIHLGSVTDIRGDQIDPVDVITFGSPCQDLSIAGKRAGLKHTDNGDEETTRSGLFMEAVRIIKEMRRATNGVYPRIALWENVPGAFSSNKGEDFRIVLEELIKIVEPEAVMPTVPKNGWAYADHYCGDGWSLAYRVFNAEYWGVPQRRRRLYLVLDLGGERAREISFERTGLYGYFAEGRSPWEASPGDAENCADPADRKAAGFKELNSAKARSNGYAEEVAPCLSAEKHDASVCYGVPLGFRSEDTKLYEECGATLCNGTRPGHTSGVVQLSLFENHSQDSRYKGPLPICPMLPAQLGTGGNNTPFVVRGTYQETGIGWWNESPVGATLRTPCGGDATKNNIVVMATGQANAEINENKCPNLTCNHEAPIACIPIADQATRFSGKRGDKADGKGNGLGIGNPGDPANTLTSGDRHAVAYGVDYRNLTESPDLFPTLQAKSNGGQSLNYSGAIRVEYVVRRLTPTECARLQGFADGWAIPDHKEDFVDEEYAFWLEVRNRHATLNDKPVKDYTKKQMLSWYNKLHNDSSEYRLWGNGIALPPTLYLMQGIAEVFS